MRKQMNANTKIANDVKKPKRNTKRVTRKKDIITLRVDHDIVEWFKSHGKGYQTRINATLKRHVEANQGLTQETA
jgi:uncharacterized protein (DUF4415 family)